MTGRVIEVSRTKILGEDVTIVAVAVKGHDLGEIRGKDVSVIVGDEPIKNPPPAKEPK